jgi:putative membrane protein
LTTGIVNSFVSFIPSVLLGAPDAETALGVLPGHRLLMEGHGLEAIKLTVIGGLGSIYFSLATLPLFALMLPKFYPLLKPNLHFVLLFVITYMILTEGKIKKIFYSISLFLLAGFFGLLVLNNFGSNMLFPLFSGLFGIPMLMLSINTKTSLPKIFKKESMKIPKKTFLSSIGIGSLAGIISGFLPGLGASQATVLAQELSGKSSLEMNIRKFLISIGGVTTSNVIYSLLAIYLIGNARSAIAVAIGDLIEVSFNHVILFLIISIIAAGVGTIATIKLSNSSLKLIRKINYQKLCLTVIVFITSLVIIMTQLYGSLIFLTGIAIGLIPNLLGLKKTHLMGCLMFPTMLFFAGINLF